MKPMMWAALSERYGRKLVYLSATAIYVGSTVGCAIANQFPVFVMMRILQAIGASAAQAVGAGTITDLFPVNKRGNAMGLFFLGPLIGPVVGPIAGGYIDEYLGWKYIFWALAGMGGLILIMMIIFLPETSPAILRPTAAREAVAKSFIRPFRFLARPLVILTSLPYAMAYGFMYFIIATLPHQLDYRYGFSSSQIGLAYLANGIGNAMGAVFSGRYTDWMMNRKVREGDSKIATPMAKTPETRLSIMWLGILLLPLGELLYGWCIQFRIHVAVPLSVGIGVGVVQTPSNTYLVDAYQGYSASVISAANLLRCTWAGITPLFAPLLLRAIGNGWALTLLALGSCASGICIYLVGNFGEDWRMAGAHDL
ncbi:hypothetical protein EC973_008811 [Apophysomyces ossiformis]|uniref:Major facilitator superfamily (MFS) profile domain-containing protein n=1 Tax=Apophysomyces ossiformis TaxID=679940 RepID=A0A8H7BVJ0_9FUNG|nr:hypothetical protein EC973_008811 [Apophysomyces ossiformis]